MDVLQDLSEDELDTLRDKFRAVPCGLRVDEFIPVLRKYLKKGITEQRLRVVFDDIDFNGDDYVTWEEFSMYIINESISHSRSIAEVDKIHEYRLSHVIPSDVPNSVKILRYIPECQKVAQVIRSGRATKLRVSEWQEHGDGFVAESHQDSARMCTARFLSVEYVPDMESLAASSSELTLSFYHLNAPKEPTNPHRFFYSLSHPDGMGKKTPLLKCTHNFKLDESQTVLKWNAKHHRLMAGSRTGKMSIWNCSGYAPVLQDIERFHTNAITAIVCFDEHVVTSSLDGTIKVSDITKETTSTTLTGGHDTGVACLAFWPDQVMLFSSGFDCEPLVWNLKLPGKKPQLLHDKLRPHRGGIVGLFHVPDSYQLVSADTKGSVKIWDMRQNACVSTTTTNTLNGACPVTSFSYIVHRKSILVCGRGLSVLMYGDTQRPMDVDDFACNQVAVNGTTIITMHKGRMKLWEFTTGRVIASIDLTFDADITCLCGEPRGRRMYVGTSMGCVITLNVASGEVMREVEIDQGRAGPISAVGYTHLPGGLRGHSGDTRMLIVTVRSGVFLIPDVEGDPLPFSLSSFRSVLSSAETLLSPTWLSESHSSRLKTATIEGHATFVFHDHNVMALVTDSNVLFAVDLETCSNVTTIDCGHVTDVMAAVVSLAPAPYVLIAYMGGTLNVVCIDPKALGHPPCVVWDHSVAGITSMAYDAVSGMAMVGDERGDISAYDITFPLQSPPKLAKSWTTGTHPVTALALFQWDAGVAGACGVLAMCGECRVEMFGLLGTPLGVLSQSRGVSKYGLAIPPFATEDAKAAAVEAYRDWSRAASHRSSSVPHQTPEEVPVPVPVIMHDFFVTHVDVAPMFVSPPKVPRLALCNKHAAKEHLSGTRRTLVAPSVPLGLTPRPAEERIPTMDQTQTSFPASDVYPSGNVRTAFRPPRPPVAQIALSSLSMRYLRKLGANPDQKVNDVRMSLRAKGNVVFDEEGLDVSEDPSPRQLFPPKTWGEM